MLGKVRSLLDKQIFSEKILEIESTLYHVAKSILVSDKDSEDAVQEAILKGYEKLSTLKNDQYFKTWLVRILINTCYGLKRSEKLTTSYEDYFETECVEDKQDYSELYQAIFELKQPIRITIILYYIEGYSVEEIKKILRIPSGTVKSRLAKGRRLLKLKLENMEVIYE